MRATADRQERSLEDLRKQLGEAVLTAEQEALALQRQLKDLQKNQDVTQREYEQGRFRWASEAQEWAIQGLNLEGKKEILGL